MDNSEQNKKIRDDVAAQWIARKREMDIGSIAPNPNDLAAYHEKVPLPILGPNDQPDYAPAKAFIAQLQSARRSPEVVGGVSPEELAAMKLQAFGVTRQNPK